METPYFRLQKAGVKMQTQPPKTDTQFRYFAFISYSHKDAAWAKWLQKQLENYRLPARLIRDYEDLPKKISPVFRDETDLSGFTVKEALCRELEVSRYLVVICSPRSCRSEYVCDEIAHFVSLGRERDIIPFIVEGEPFSENAETECFPRPLRELESDPLGISVAELGKRRAFLRVISTLLNIRFDELVRRDVRRQRARFAAAAAVVLALLSGIAGLAWYNMPHSRYYNAYALRNEVPEGIYALTREEQSRSADSYRITTRRGNVIRLERVNSLGFPTDTELVTVGSQFPVQEFEYDDRGKLISVENRDASGMLISRKVLTYNPQTSQIAIDYRQPSNNIQAQALQADVSYRGAVAGQRSRSQITRELNTYDENGRLIRTEYQKDNLGNPACDSNGVYGKLYVYDDRGLMVRMSNLDQDGQIRACRYGWAAVEYTYDETGNFLSEQYYDEQGVRVRNADGFSGSVLTYDEYGNALTVQRFDEAGNTCSGKDGIARQSCRYDDRGFPVSVRNFDAEGNPAYNSEGIHEIRRTYDEKGSVREAAFYDTEGNPSWSGDNSCASVRWVTDEQGRIVEQWHYDTLGEPVCHRETGAYGVRCEYDENGFRSGVTYLDAQGNPVMTRYGYAQERGQTSPSGLLLRTEYLDGKGNPVRNRENIAAAEFSYDNLGNQTGVRFYDEEGNPCYYAEGYARAEYAYEGGDLVSIRYFDLDGNPTMTDGYCHEIRYEYDGYGRCVRSGRYNTAGELNAAIDECALEERDYDRFGNVLQIRYYDRNGELSPAMDFHTVTYRYDGRSNVIHTAYGSNKDLVFFSKDSEYDARDNCIREIYYDREGKPVSDPSLHAAEQRNTYDDRGNLIYRIRLGPDGLAFGHDVPVVVNAMANTYDAYGNTTLHQWFHADARGETTCLEQRRYAYDGTGNIILYEYLDGEGNYRNNEDGYAVCRTPYDAAGNLICQEYYGEEGKPALFQGTVFRFEYTYNAAGEILEERRYGTDGQLIREDAGVPARIVYTYDARGNRTKEAFYSAGGNLYDGGKGKHAIAELYYDELGRLQQTVLYDSQGQQISQTELMVILYEVMKESQAQAAGLLDNDILIRLGDWNIFDFDSEDALFAALGEALTTWEGQEKPVHICRVGENQKLTFLEVTLPAGQMGTRLADKSFQSSLTARIREEYSRWLKNGKP